MNLPNQFADEPDEDVVLWRFFTPTKFEKLLKDSALWFCRSDRFEDQFEGTITANDSISRETRYRQAFAANCTNFENFIATAVAFQEQSVKNARRAYYVSCWHENAVDSSAMWEKYCPQEPGVAVKTTFGHLKNSLQGQQPMPVMFSRVHYIDYATESIPRGNSSFVFLYKHTAYKDEREVRAILNYLETIPYENAISPDPDYPSGLNLTTDLPLLVDALFVRPGTKMSQITALLSQYGPSLPTPNTSAEAKPLRLMPGSD